jgi:hypothetical protein
MKVTPRLWWIAAVSLVALVASIFYLLTGDQVPERKRMATGTERTRASAEAPAWAATPRASHPSVVEETPLDPPSAQPGTAPSPSKSKLAAQKVAEISELYAALAAQHDEASKAVAKARTESRDPAPVWQAKVDDLSQSYRLLALVQSMENPEISALLEDALKDSQFFVATREYLHRRVKPEAFAAGIMSAKSPAELISYATHAAEAHRPQYERTLQLMRVSPSLAQGLEQKVSSELTCQLLQSFMAQDQRRYSPAARHFLTPQEETVVARNSQLPVSTHRQEPR